MAKSVRVHDDTHSALKKLKAQKRRSSIDQVIREMIRESTGSSPESVKEETETEELTSYTEP